MRSAVIGAALIAVVLRAPSWVSASTEILGLACLGQLLASLLPRDDFADQALLGIVGVAVTVMLLGLLLDVGPWGLTRDSFAIGVSLVTMAALAFIAFRHEVPTLWPRVIRAPILVACALLISGCVGAFVLATAGVRHEGDARTLSISALSFGGSQATLGVLAHNDGQSYQLIVLPDGQASNADVFGVGTRRVGTTEIAMHVKLPIARCYWELLLRADTPRMPTERRLKLWVGTSSSGLLKHSHGSSSLQSGGHAVGALPRRCLPHA